MTSTTGRQYFISKMTMSIRIVSHDLLTSGRSDKLRDSWNLDRVEEQRSTVKIHEGLIMLEYKMV